MFIKKFLLKRDGLLRTSNNFENLTDQKNRTQNIKVEFTNFLGKENVRHL